MASTTFKKSSKARHFFLCTRYPQVGRSIASLSPCSLFNFVLAPKPKATTLASHSVRFYFKFSQNPALFSIWQNNKNTTLPSSYLFDTRAKTMIRNWNLDLTSLRPHCLSLLLPGSCICWDIAAGPAFRFTQWLESIRKRIARNPSFGFPYSLTRLPYAQMEMTELGHGEDEKGGTQGENWRWKRSF